MSQGVDNPFCALTRQRGSLKKSAAMRSSQFYISTALAAVCLILSIWIIAAGSSNQKLQTELSKQQQQLQAQQEQINAGNVISQQIGPNILRDMAMVSVEDDAMKQLLSKHGYTVNVQATPAPGSTPAPSSTPAPAAATPASTPAAQ